MIRLAASALTIAAVVLTACGPGAPPPTTTAPPDLEAEFVVDPLTGYPLVSAPSRRVAVREAYAALRAGAPPAGVAESAIALLDEDPGYHPARVLLAQTDFVSARYGEAAERLRPIVDEMPDYVAAALLHARSLERKGDVVEAYAAYRDLSDIQTVAAERASALAERALEIVHRRLDDALRRGRVEDAQEILARLETWRPDDGETLEARLEVMRAAGDEEGELEVLRRLVAAEEQTAADAAAAEDPAEDSVLPEDPLAPYESPISDPRRQRRLDLAELEVEIGDLRQGLELLERLEPSRLSTTERERFLEIRDRALFLRRLDLMPPEVAALAEEAELDRADLATLFYWLLPGVRYAPLDNPPIAGDIVDRRERKEILLVLDQHLMQVDETVHRFAPEEEARRIDALRGVLAHLASSRPVPACLDGVRGGADEVADETRPWICDRAARCGLIAEEASCLPSVPLSGGEALEIVRRGLAQLGNGADEDAVAP